MAAPRITLSLKANGEFELHLNSEGRDLLVRELLRLDERNDHFHLGPEPVGEVEVRTVAYDASDTVIEYGKVLFRPDEWDREFYPHVMAVPAGG